MVACVEKTVGLAMASREFVAIVGSVDASREYEPPLAHVDSANEACVQLGRALAAAGYGIVVYSSDREFIEAAVVDGYLDAPEKVADGSIHVVYPGEHRSAETNFVQQQSALDSKFRLRRDASRNWDVSFYRSLFEADAVLIVGGGRSSFTSGLVALSAEKAVVPVAAFGGAAERVLTAMQRSDRRADESDAAVMGRREWREGSAVELVEALANQRRAINQRASEARTGEAKLARRRWVPAVWSAVLMLLALACAALALTVTDPGELWHYMLLLGIPVLAGAAGGSVHAAIWSVDDPDPLARSIALGLVAGAVTALLYLMAQLFTGSGVDLGDLDSRQYQGAAWFALIIGFIAGLTFDAVFSRLQKTDVVDTSAVTPS